ncbi:glycosidase [Methanosarcinales archaeon]|nr:MAG: glycosidase [Methanosarcinales archaeon]
MLKIVSERNTGVKEVRNSKTFDIVRRMGVITADKVRLKRHPVSKPVTIFNPALMIEGDKASIYGRIILGYFTYASAVAEIVVSVDDILSETISERYLTAEIKLIPDNRFDIWGVEDPRVSEVDGNLFMTYCGRTVNYFDASKRANRTFPIAAIRENGIWRKTCVFRLPVEFRDFLVSDKDAFICRVGDRIRLFHRPHMMDERFYLAASEVSDDALHMRDLTEVSVSNTHLICERAKFEERIGWGTPPIKVAKDEYLLLLHGISMEIYRVFAVLMNENLEITAVSPHYIMEPRENYEVYGDRPFVVFPCGAQVVDDEIIISYGAADSAIGFGVIDLSELLSILDSNRI